MDQIEVLIKKHEGIRLKPYKDTVGKWTIGIGRNLDDVGITEEEAMYLFRGDLSRVVDALRAGFDWFEQLSEVRQAVLIDMCFNLGINGLSKFRMMLGHCANGEFSAASVEMLNSRWAGQVGGRAIELAAMMEIGEWSHE